jgi:cobalamin synthase
VSGDEFAVIAAVVIAGSLGIAVLVQRHADDQEQETARQLHGMYHVGRVVFSAVGIAAIVAGLVLDAPVIVLGGVASLIAGLGQHWASRTFRR